ncbi:hypothetical protein Back11_17850 [Paenibacillus baekrokdamisoli]|uniref:Uncharacterized protein n=1 Tax=Paenibacillus baekrokdamisoli TaxID=1712516 RepID=A0A3G9INL3_9BACL|nr:toll/interleukin-1 receptor domain-containing protein [Paenibacillus baekrokdamisoli]MBB3073480.1 hypothetical protein [Paenibacillus baekrokdamisoli]BBH20440.1 hypothetical protein Back11_17850 [Paenibacillus baekrokdamisoli]
MKVFISWSGELSRQLGEAIKTWLPGVLQAVRPYFTPNDIEKGARWADDISKNLEECRVGILCMTREALSSPWMMFEAGALSKQLGKSYVCPILFNVENSDIVGPLTQFQSTQFSKDELKKLLVTINSQTLDNKLDSSILNDVFEMWWPRLEGQVNTILSSFTPEDPENNRRSDRELIEEILELTRRVNTRSRKEVNSTAVIDLVEARNKIASECNNTSDFVIANYLNEMDKPLNYLIQMVRNNDPELYRRLRETYVELTVHEEEDLIDLITVE